MDELFLIRLYAGAKAKDIEGVLKRKFPGIDKTLISKCENDRYGVCLNKAAMRMLRDAFPDAAQRANFASASKRKDRHKKRRRIVARLTEEEYERLQLYLNRNGTTMQAFLESVLPDDTK